jgi:PAS domain S-box-containing protein
VTDADALEREVEFLDTLFRSAPLAMALLDAELRFLRVNEPLAELTGVPLAEHVGRYVLDVMPRHNAQIVRDLRRVVASGEPLVGSEVTGETPRAPGVPRTFRRSHYPVRGADGRVIGVVSVVEEITEMRRAAAAVREGEARLREAFEQSPISTVVYDAPSGVPVALNPAFTRLWGLTIADVPPGYTVFNDRQLQEAGVIPLVRRAFAGEAVSLPPISYDFTKVVGRGGALWTRAHLYPLRDESGVVRQVVLSHEDVTARLRAEAALVAARREAESGRDAAERARTQVARVLESITDAFYTIDRDARVTYVNPAALAMWRTRSAADVLGRSLWEIFPDAVGSPFQSHTERVLRDGVTLDYEEFYAPLDAWLAVRAYPSPDGATVMVRDVTARKRAEEALRFLGEAELAFAGSLDVEATLDTVARLVVPQWAEWCTVDLVQDDGALRLVAVAHRDPEKVALAWELRRRYPIGDRPDDSPFFRVLRTGRSERVAEIPDELVVASARDEDHLRILRSLGLKSALAVPLTARGRTIGVITLLSGEGGRRYTDADLALAERLAGRAALAVDNARLYATERQARAEAEEARRAAEAANLAKSQFLGTMSHELRTPLNAIAGYVDLMQLGIRGPITDEQRSDLARIKRSAQVLMALVTDILNFARLEAGQVEFRHESVRLADVAADIEALVEPQVGARGLTYRYAPDAPAERNQPLAVWADAERLKQVLLNLLTNAVKFTDAGGRVELVWGFADDDNGGGSVARIRVRDSGRGIPPDRLDQIFQPFVQVDRHLTQTSQQGVGLGLAISRDLARRMGGDLTVESALGEGSTFTLTLPAARTRT